MMKGKFIVIEGTDCSGKETQSKLIEKKLKELGYKCIHLAFPMYDTPPGKVVGDCYLGRNGKGFFDEGATNVDPYIAALYYAADRKYNINKIIDSYNDGYYIILDRYTTSNMAHQGSKILDKDERFYMYQWIDKLEFWLLGLPKPDKTIFLHMPYKYSLELKKERNSLDEHEKDEDYLKRSEAAYIELSELYGWDRVECVDYDDRLKSPEEINDEIMKILES